MTLAHKNISKYCETYQIHFYFIGIIAGALIALLFPLKSVYEFFLTPALMALFFVTFIQIPFSDVIRGLRSVRFIAAILLGNFILLPIVIALIAILWNGLWSLWFGSLASNDVIQTIFEKKQLLAVIFIVLLAPCVDYVVSFCRFAKGDAAQLTAVTPVLLLLQYAAFLIFFWYVLAGTLKDANDAWSLIMEASWIFLFPLVLAFIFQLLKPHSLFFSKITIGLQTVCVPVTAVALFTIMAYAVSSILPKIGIDFSLLNLLQNNVDLQIGGAGQGVSPNDLQGQAADSVSLVTKLGFAALFYIVFSVVAPFVGLFASRLMRLEKDQKIAVMFSVSTRNSLVILPFFMLIDKEHADFYSVVILTQTCVELLAQLYYVKWIPMMTSIKKFEKPK